MRRATAWVVVFAVLAAWAGTAARARADGFWVSLAAGAAGGASPSDYTEFWFDSPHAPQIAVNQLSGTGTVQAITGGGTTFFSSLGTPVLLPTGDGYATLTNLDVANGSGGLPRFAGGTQASGAPLTGLAIPTDANAHGLSASLTEPADNGDSVLTVDVTDPTGTAVGQGQVTVPGGGWWVIGIGPGGQGGTEPPPGPDPDPVPNPDPVPVPVPVPVPEPGQGTVATPEPASLVLLGMGGMTAAGWRKIRRRK